MRFTVSHIILLLGFISLSCQSQRQKSSDDLNSTIKQYFQAEYTSKTNENTLLTLAWITSDKGGTPVLKYAVWNNKSEEIIYEGTAIRGKVEWLDDYSILVVDYPGIINDESQLYRYKINIKTKVKTILNESSTF